MNSKPHSIDSVSPSGRGERQQISAVVILAQDIEKLLRRPVRFARKFGEVLPLAVAGKSETTRRNTHHQRNEQSGADQYTK